MSRIPRKRPRDAHRAFTPADLAIIGCLSRDARMPVANVAASLGLPESTVRHRLGRLVQDGVVHFTAVTDPLKLGYPIWVTIGLEVEMRRVRSVAKALARFDEVYFVAISTGGYEIMLAALFRSSDDLLSFLVDRIAAIPGVTRTATYQHLQVVKRNLSLLPFPADAGALTRSPRSREASTLSRRRERGS